MAAQGRPSLWIHGSSGRMGTEIQKALIEQGQPFRLLGGSGLKFEGEHFLQGRDVTPELLATALQKSAPQVVVDFSTPEANRLLLAAVRASATAETAFVLGTTGMPKEQVAEWRAIAAERRHRVLVAPNTSIGVLLLAKASLMVAGVAAGLGFDVEIVETHHRAKKDAPSGTAKFLAETLAGGVDGLSPVYDRGDAARQPGELGVHAVRGGAVYGEHEIRVIGDAEEVTLSHRAFSRALFASGALTLCRWLLARGPGFYGLLDVEIDDLKALKA